MAINPAAAGHLGDPMRLIRELSDRVDALENALSLESASIGEGGLDVRGGAVVIYDAAGNEQMRLSTQGLTLDGLLRVIGAINVIGGGDISVTDGRLIAADETGHVFRVDPTVPEIFMRPELITNVARQVVGDAVEFDSQPTSGSRSGGSFGTFGTITGAGPSVDFTVVNGSFLALWGAQVDVTADVGEDVAGWMDLDVDGPTSSSPPNAPTVGTGALGRIGASAESGTQILHTSIMVGRRYVVEPGEYTVEALYRTDDVSGSPPLSRATWQERFLLVIAF